MRTVAALYVDPRGPYPKMPGVECWDEARDARLYAGPHPVVAHPPCQRWGRMAKFCQARWGLRVGADGGLFALALDAVRRWGGVLEHPAWSYAWAAHGLVRPRAAAWQRTLEGEWVCSVAQVAYGHRATKETWLVYVGDAAPAAVNPAAPAAELVVGSCTRLADGSFKRRVSCERMGHLERRVTPTAFAEFLVGIARSCRRTEAA
jgi:hypothetical protein